MWSTRHGRGWITYCGKIEAGLVIAEQDSVVKHQKMTQNLLMLHIWDFCHAKKKKEEVKSPVKHNNQKVETTHMSIKGWMDK